MKLHPSYIADLQTLSPLDNLWLKSSVPMFMDTACILPVDNPFSLEVITLSDIRFKDNPTLTVIDKGGNELYVTQPILVEDSYGTTDPAPIDTSTTTGYFKRLRVNSTNEDAIAIRTSGDIAADQTIYANTFTTGGQNVTATKISAWDAHIINTANPHSTTFAQLLSKPTTLAGYGITDAFTQTLADARYPQLSVQYTNPTWLAGIDATTIKTGTIDLARLPAMPSANTIVCTTIPAMTAGDQLLVAKGTVVIESTTGNTYRYSGTGSVVLNASYIQQSDMTPDWAVITNKPTNVSTWTNDAGYLTAASSLAWAKLTGVPSTFAPSAHTHAIADTTGLQAALDAKLSIASAASTYQPLGAYLTLSSVLAGYVVGTNTAIAATDSVLGAFQKLQGQINNKQASGSYSLTTHNHDTAYLGIGANAVSATKLATARTIAGVAFDGTSNISIPFANLTTIPSTFAPSAHTHTQSDITGLETRLAGIDGNWANYATTTALTNGLATKSDTSHGHTFASLTSKPTTLAGYGITDAQSNLGYTPVQQGGGTGQGTNKLYIGWSAGSLLLQVDSTNYGNNWPIGITGYAAGGSADSAKLGGQLPSYYINTSDSRLSDARTPSAHTHAWSDVTGKPTTLGGYGITDASLSTHNHDATYLKLAAGSVHGAGTYANTYPTLAVGDGQYGISALGGVLCIYSNTGIVTIKSRNGAAAAVTMGDIWHTGNFNPATKSDSGHTHAWTSGLTGVPSQVAILANATTHGSLKLGNSAVGSWHGIEGSDANLTRVMFNDNTGNNILGFHGLNAAKSSSMWYVSWDRAGNMVNGFVPWSCITGQPSVVAGTGLSGTGQLTGNVTLSVAYGTVAGTACVGNDSRLSDARTPNNNGALVQGSTSNTGAQGKRTIGLGSGANVINSVLDSGFYDSESSTNPNGNWMHIINSAHNNNYAGNQYQFQIGASFSNSVVQSWGPEGYWVRTICGNAQVGAWRRLWHDGNLIQANSSTNGWLSSTDWNTFNGKQANLGYTPVQQGGGTGQGTNKLYIGWSSSTNLRIQVDSTDFGNNWPISVSGNAATASNVAWSGITSKPTTLAGYGITDAVGSTTLTGYLAKAGDSLNDNALIISYGSGAGGFFTQMRNPYYPDDLASVSVSAGIVWWGRAGICFASAKYTGNATTGDVTFSNVNGGFKFSSPVTFSGGQTFTGASALAGGSTVNGDLSVGSCLYTGYIRGNCGWTGVGDERYVFNGSARFANTLYVQDSIIGTTFRGVSRSGGGTTVFATSTGNRNAISNGTTSSLINRYDYAGFVGFIDGNTEMYGFTQDHEYGASAQLSIIAGSSSGGNISFFAGAPTAIANGCYQTPKVGGWTNSGLSITGYLIASAYVIGANAAMSTWAINGGYAWFGLNGTNGGTWATANGIGCGGSETWIASTGNIRMCSTNNTDALWITGTELYSKNSIYSFGSFVGSVIAPSDSLGNASRIGILSSNKQNGWCISYGASGDMQLWDSTANNWTLRYRFTQLATKLPIYAVVGSTGTTIAPPLYDGEVRLYKGATGQGVCYLKCRATTEIVRYRNDVGVRATISTAATNVPVDISGQTIMLMWAMNGASDGQWTMLC